MTLTPAQVIQQLPALQGKRVTLRGYVRYATKVNLSEGELLAVGCNVIGIALESISLPK